MTSSDRALPRPPGQPEDPGGHASPGLRLTSLAAGIAARVGAANSDLLAVAGLAVLAGALYLWNLTISGFANTYYAMAAQAGAADWRAFFFGSLDAGNFITLDKPPAATWAMSLFVRAFGLSAWSVLLPQALLGVAAVLVLYLAVRRSFGRPAGVLAAIVLAVTPSASLIFRYDNPDALLTFLLVTAAWALGRGVERGRLRWVILAASLVGFGFLTKFLQAYLLLPAFAAMWLLAAPVSLRRRLAGLVAAGLTVLVTSAWWVAIVELIPASSRPYIGGSTNNSVLDLVFGYDGLGRIFGQGVGGGPTGRTLSPGAGFGGTPGILRMFNLQFGGEISWLIPLALACLVVGLVIHRRVARPDRRRAGYVLWGGWLLVHVAVFSFMTGIAHPYYSVMLAPAIGALVGAGVSDLWRLRERHLVAGLVLATGLVGTAIWALVVLGRVPAFAPGLGIAAIALAAFAGLVLVLPSVSVDRRLQGAALALGLIAALAGSAAFTVATTTRALAGGDPTAGPAGSAGGPGPVGDFGIATNTKLIDYLLAHRGASTWIVAAQGSGNSAAIQLAAGAPVLTMGGFSGTDPAPTQAQLEALIASGRLRYVLVGGQGGPGGPGGTSTRTLSSWVTGACSVVTGIASGTLTSGGGSGATLYDCAGAS